MNVKFKKNVTVDYEDLRAESGQFIDKNFYRDDLLKGVMVEKLSRNFSNLYFPNGDVAMSVPNNAFEVC